MEKWYSRRDFGSLEAVIEHLAMPRWAWRDPRPDEKKRDEQGRVSIAIRDESLRSICLMWRYEESKGYLWAVWVEQRRATEQSMWTETGRFPRLFRLKRGLQGKWEVSDVCITAKSNEWKYLAPADLRQMLTVAPNKIASGK